MKQSFFLFSILFLYLFPTHGIVLDTHYEPRILGKNLYLFEDDERSSLETILPKIDQFKKSLHEVPTLGYTQSNLWAFLQLESKISSDWVLEIDAHLLDKVEFYLLNARKIEYQEIQSRLVPFGSQGSISRRVYAFNFSTEMDKNYAIFLKAKTDETLALPLKIFPKSLDQSLTDRENLIFGIYYGIMIAMIIYHLFIFLSLRDMSYLFFSLFLISYLLFQLTILGHSFVYIWPKSPSWNQIAQPFFICCFMLFLTVFSKQFLNTRSLSKTLDLVHIIMILISSLGIIFSLLSPYKETIPVITLMSLTTIFLVIASGLKGLFFRKPSAKYFLAASINFLLSSIVVIMMSFGLLEYGFFTLYGIQIGSVIFALILSFALANKFQIIQKAREEAQRENIELLEKTNQLKNDFLAKTSHELRTPLHGIINLSEDISSGNIDSQQSQKNALLIQNNAKRLNRLVNDILDHEKLKHKNLKLELKSLPLRPLVELTFEISKTLLKRKDIHLINEVDKSIIVSADEDRLLQILQNLVSNAIKFTHQGEIRVQSEETSKGVTVHIRDTGIGIPEDKQQSIFESFEQVDSSLNRNNSGTGLGLTIVKQLVELHGGTIELQSQTGVGSEFSFDLKLGNPAELSSELIVSNEKDAFSPIDESQEPEKQPGKSDLPLVFVIDDDPTNLEIVKSHLTGKFRLKTFLHGKEVLQCLQKDSPALVLLDIMMPEMNGFEVIRNIRELHPHEELPVIFLTALHQASNKEEGFRNGANDYLPKPFDRLELLARLKNQLLYSKYRNRWILQKEFQNELFQGKDEEQLIKAFFETLQKETSFQNIGFFQQSKIFLFQGDQKRLEKLYQDECEDSSSIYRESIFEFDLLIELSSELEKSDKVLIEILKNQFDGVVSLYRRFGEDINLIQDLYQISMEQEWSYIKAEGRTTNLIGEKKSILNSAIKRLKLYFPSNKMLQISRSLVINPQKVEKVQSSRNKLVLEMNGEQLSVGRTFIKKVKSFLKVS